MIAQIFHVNLNKRIDELGIDLDGMNKKDLLNLDSPKDAKKNLDGDIVRKKK